MLFRSTISPALAPLPARPGVDGATGAKRGVPTALASVAVSSVPTSVTTPPSAVGPPAGVQRSAG